MKLVCSKANLLNGVQIVSKAVPSKTTMSILECILVDTTNDMELGIETTIEGQIIEKGIIALDAKIFLEIVRKLPDSDITIETDASFKTVITCEKAKFTIIGKGNKERTNYLNKKTKDALIKYLKIRDNSHDNNKKHNNALFLTFYGYRMSQFTINKIVKRAYRKAELDENVYTVHTLRHTCATLLYRSGVNIKTIQELLGHVHIDTTEIYTHLDNQEVKDVMFEHPLAQFKMEDALAYCA